MKLVTSEYSGIAEELTTQRANEHPTGHSFLSLPAETKTRSLDRAQVCVYYRGNTVVPSSRRLNSLFFVLDERDGIVIFVLFRNLKCLIHIGTVVE